MNKVILIGRLGKDPELSYTPSGTAICKFSLATTEHMKDKDGKKQEKTTWHNIVAWTKLAEICGQYLNKGSQVMVDGRIDNRTWEKDGQKHYMTEIVIHGLEMLGGKIEKKETKETPNTNQPVDPKNPLGVELPSKDEDDLPF